MAEEIHKILYQAHNLNGYDATKQIRMVYIEAPSQSYIQYVDCGKTDLQT